MATLELGRLWLNPAASLNEGRGFRLHKLNTRPVTRGDFRPYAGGRVRLVLRPGGAKQQHDATLRHLDIPAVRQLEEWVGVLLLVRDPWGGRFWGSYLAPDISWLNIGIADVQLQILEVSHDEGV